MDRVKEVEKRRREILKEMGGIRSMRRGSVNEQFLKVPQKGKKEPVLRGPYYVFSRFEKGKGTKSYRLDEGKVEELMAKAEKLLPENEEQKEETEKQIGYFRNNASRMRYGEFREQGLFVGSGVVEAGCKTVVGKRLKQSGMEWTVRGANAIIALRCLHLSGRMEEYWEQKEANA